MLFKVVSISFCIRYNTSSKVTVPLKSPSVITAKSTSIYLASVLYGMAAPKVPSAFLIFTFLVIDGGIHSFSWRRFLISGFEIK